jgi:membrane protein DedA with SNARE-associated domain
MALTEESSLSTAATAASEISERDEAAPVKRDKKQIIGRLGALLLAVGITGAILIFAPQIRQFSRLGYLGVFLINLISDATIVVPIPGLGITFVAASVLSWPLVGLASGAGQALGESTGYLAGYGGGVVVENRKWYPRLQYWMENYGFLTLFTLAAIPNPLVDLAGMTAGMMRYSYPKFLLAVWLGKTVKSLIFAWAGAHSINWLFFWFS